MPTRREFLKYGGGVIALVAGGKVCYDAYKNFIFENSNNTRIIEAAKIEARGRANTVGFPYENRTGVLGFVDGKKLNFNKTNIDEVTIGPEVISEAVISKNGTLESFKTRKPDSSFLDYVWRKIFGYESL